MEPDEPQPILFDPLKEASERILTEYYETTVGVENATLLTEPDRRNRIWQCWLTSSDSYVPQTVIIKQVRPDGYDPSHPESWDTNRFFNDWAGAWFLSKVAREEGHGPAFYGGNLEQGFIILEDMGEHISLVEPLLKGDAASASDALIAFTHRLGRMHAASLGKEAVYQELKRAISPAWADLGDKSSDAVIEERTKQVTEFAENCALLDVEVDETAKQELMAALQQLGEPGPFRTFIHGDPCPDNVFYHAPELRLIDFEFSTFGHALRDGLYGRLPFPTCWCANTIPPEIVQNMETTYRAALSSVCPEARDDQRFAQETSAVAASWALNTVGWHLKDALEQEGNWGIAGVRPRVLTRLAMALAAARNAHQMPALCDVYEKILAELQTRWPDATPLPFYPAFRTA